MFDIGRLDGCPSRGLGVPDETGKPNSREGGFFTNGAVYLLSEYGNPDCQRILVREYFTPKLHRRLLVGRFVNQMWAWDDRHHYWTRLKVWISLSPAMKKYYIKQAYPFVDARRQIEGKTIHEHISCHRLMAAVWCPNPDPEHRTQVDHLNGDLDDYSQFNLEWVTPEENIRRRWVNYYARKNKQ